MFTPFLALIMHRFVFLYFILLFSSLTYAQKTVTFKSSDDLLITADLYEQNSQHPYIVLFHQAGYSRGEYKETAQKLVNLGYNCLAVDLRSGKEVNFVKNETAQRALEDGKETDYLSARPDMEAAIEYAFKKSEKRVIILGSSYSASLSLVIAASNHRVKAVIAYSPGEYFNGKLNVKNSISKIRKPVYISSSKREENFIKQISQHIPKEYKTLFVPFKGNGIHGSRSLWSDCDSSDEYWLSLTMFFIKIKDTK